MTEADCSHTSSTSSFMLKRLILNDNQFKKRQKLSSIPNDSTNISSRPLIPISTRKFRLIWLISDTNHFGEILQTSIALVRDVINSVKSFSDLDQCRKVRGVYTNPETICETFKQDVRLLNRNLIPSNVFPQVLSTDLNEIDPSFMYSQLLKEIFIDMPHDDNEKQALVDFCRKKYADNDTQMKIITEFEQQYDKPSPSWWYTRECFLYWMLNAALRTHDTETILYMGCFLRDLHCQIDRLYSQTKPHNPLTLFRGQGILHMQFDNMNKNKGGLLSFNNFLSTSTNRQVGYLYTDSARQNPDLIGVLFRIDIDPPVSTAPFAFVRESSYYGNEEEEVLVSMHSVFRIDAVEQMEDRLWQIQLILTSDNDPICNFIYFYSNSFSTLTCRAVVRLN